MAGTNFEHATEGGKLSARQVDAIGWGAFFIWIGFAFLANVGWGVALVGIGVIMLAGQLARMRSGLPVERFGLLIGMLFVVGGTWELLEARLGQEPIAGGVMPVLSIALGVALVVSAFLRKRKQGVSGQRGRQGQEDL